MRVRDTQALIVGAVVIVLIVCVVGYAAIRLSAMDSKRVARILLAFAVVITALPAVLYALYGTQ